MARFRHRILRRLGYVPVSEVRDLAARISRRLEQLDEPLAREYVLDPYPGGIEHKIMLMCQRRQAMLATIAEEELDRLLSAEAAPPAA